jgi:hypothetical protein
MKHTGMKKTDPKERLFSRNPRISLADVRGWIERQKQGDETVKVPLIKFIDHRLRGRYITPLQNVEPRKYRSGFLMMASACLLIETLQAFREGKNESEVGSEAAFMRFFEENGKTFSGLRNCFPLIPKKDKQGVPVKDKQGNAVKKCTFYKHIRCGIFHQAESTGGYGIVRDESDLFDPVEHTVNADEFIDEVETCLDKYLNELRSSAVTSERWNKAADKLTYICDNFEK